MAKFNGLKAAIEAVQGLDQTSRQRLLKDLKQKAPEIAKKIEEGLFTFSDIQFLTKTDFQKLWWEISREKWLLALRKTSPNVLKMIEKFTTRRAFQELSQQIKQKGPRPAREVLQAQKEIIDTIRSWAAEGKMAAPQSKKNDPMV